MSKQQLKILIIEDNQDDYNLMLYYLEKCFDKNYITHCTSYKKFLRLEDKASYDCIITDYNLNGYSGLNVINYLWDRFIYKPIVIVTGYVKEDDFETLSLIPIDRFLLKNDVKNIVCKVSAAIEEYDSNKIRKFRENSLLRKNIISEIDTYLKQKYDTENI